MKIRKNLLPLLFTALSMSACGDTQKKLLTVSWPSVNKDYPIFFGEYINPEFRARVYTSNEKLFRQLDLGPQFYCDSLVVPHREAVSYTKGQSSKVEWSTSAGVKVGYGGSSASVTFGFTNCTSSDSSTTCTIKTTLYPDSHPKGYYKVVRNEIGRKFWEIAYTISDNKVRLKSENGIEYVKVDAVYYSLMYSMYGDDNWKPIDAHFDIKY